MAQKRKEHLLSSIRTYSLNSGSKKRKCAEAMGHFLQPAVGCRYFSCSHKQANPGGIFPFTIEAFILKPKSCKWRLLQKEGKVGKEWLLFEAPLMMAEADLTHGAQSTGMCVQLGPIEINENCARTWKCRELLGGSCSMLICTRGSLGFSISVIKMS